MDFNKDLEEQLTALRSIEGFPLGTDADILALSQPPFYTACQYVCPHCKAQITKSDSKRETITFFDKIIGKADLNAKEREDALYKPPPAIVQAYWNVYREFPKSWILI